MNDHNFESDTETPLGEVRYSLTQMLREVEAERSSSARAKEMVDQNEISQLFGNARIDT